MSQTSVKNNIAHAASTTANSSENRSFEAQHFSVDERAWYYNNIFARDNSRDRHLLGSHIHKRKSDSSPGLIYRQRSLDNASGKGEGEADSGVSLSCAMD